MNVKTTILFWLIITLTSCSNNKPYSPALDEYGKFKHFISLENKKFKDGAQDFYPMIMNYSVDMHLQDSTNEKFIYLSPRSSYHPNYPQNKVPWGRDSSKTDNYIDRHFCSIKDMGFNTIRLTGFTPTDFHGGFQTWGKVDVSNTDEGNENIKTKIVPLIKLILYYAEKNKLRVILLISAIETQPENQLNFYSKIAEELKENKALMAYDIYNEPIFCDKGDYTKNQTKEFVKNYTNAIKKNAPNHLTTIGLSHYKIAHEWDPELMEVDFLAYHVYPYGSINLNKLERYEAKLYWIAKNTTKPWVIGETGLNTAENCEPLNFAWGSYSDQLKFMSYSLQKIKECGASGYAWWNFQDVALIGEVIEGVCKISDYGLVNRKLNEYFTNSNGDTIIGGLKHKITDLPFSDFLKNDPYKFLDNPIIEMPDEKVYYNIDYLPEHQQISGKIVDENNRPVIDAIITINNPISKAVYTTFSKPDGSFDLKTGWTDVSKHLDFKIRITAVKKETIETSLGTIYSHEKNEINKIILKNCF